MIQTVNNNLSVLPWYTDIALQNHKKPYAFDAIYPLLSPPNRLLPFQVLREIYDSPIQSLYVCNLKGKILYSLSRELLETSFKIKKYEDSDSLIYYGDSLFSFKLSEGPCYLVLSDGRNTWFSEVFTVVDDLSKCIKLEWWDNEDLVFDTGRIVYDDRFVNTVYLQSELGKPEYTYEEEGEIRDGYFFPELRTSEKKYKFLFLAPEYLCDAIRVATISDYVRITDNYGRIYNCDTLNFEIEWQEQGDLALVTATFETNTVIKKIGKGYQKVVSERIFDRTFDNKFQ